MERQNNLGIYITANWASAVMVHHHGSSCRATNSFIVSADAEQQDMERTQFLPAAEIIQKCLDKKIAFSGSAVAIGCSSFTQDEFHSQFADHKQVGQTIKFDAEEILATDILEKTVAYNINEVNETGSEITLFSTEKKSLTDILADLQNNNIDPVAIEPDAICLARYVSDKIKITETTMVVGLKNDSCYLILPSGTKSVPLTRTFVVNPSQNKTELLARQLALTIASHSGKINVKSIILMDTTNGVDIAKLQEQTSLTIDKVNLKEQLLNDGIETADEAAIDMAIAFGAAMSTAGVSRTDFRKDFMPYQGKREVVEKSFKIISLCVIVILISLGIYFQVKLFQRNSYIRQLDKKLKDQAVQIVPKSRLRGKEAIISILKREIIKIKDQKSGKLTLESGSIAAKMNFILEAINDTTPSTDLNIATVDITSRTIRITGDTNSSGSTLKFFSAIKKHKQLVIDERFSKTAAGRNTFRVTIRPLE